MKFKLKHLFCIFIILAISVSSALSKKNAKENNKIQIDSILTIVDYDLSVKSPILIDSISIKGTPFTKHDAFKISNLIDKIEKPQSGSSIKISPKNSANWEIEKPNKKQEYTIEKSEIECVYYYAFYVNASDFVNFKINFKSTNKAKIYIDGEEKLAYTPSEVKKLKEDKSDLSLPYDKYLVVLQVLSNNKKKQYFSIDIQAKEKDMALITTSLSPKRSMNIDDVFSGKRVGRSLISPSGDMSLVSFSEFYDKDKSYSWKSLINITTEKYPSIPFIPMPGAFSIQWGKDDSVIFFCTKNDKKTNIWSYNFTTTKYNKIAENISDFSFYTVDSKDNFIIYAVTEKIEADKNVLYKIDGMEDRQSNFRKRDNLFYLDIATKTSYQLTYGKHDIRLHDISQDSKMMLYSISDVDYQTPPFSRQTMFIYDFVKRSIDTLWANKSHGLTCHFSPDNDKLLCIGSPDAFEGIGRNVSDGKLANGYDNQAFIYHLSNGKIDPISISFNPKIASSYWNPADYFIYFQVVDGEYKNLYRYNFGTKAYTRINTGEDCITGISYAKNKPIATYLGYGASNGKRLYQIDLSNDGYDMIANPEKENYENVELGEIDIWDYTNEHGDTIHGRIHYPPNFDKNKKYPVIVYYYGGTSPVGRSFGGRYPFNIYTGHGYVVYCLQPSGCTGYGQDFSALHVNSWGIRTAEDIIGGTKEMLNQHSFCDEKAVACIGASYGGFMTMLLTTKTDMFAAAISHAGISALSSYWGEGYWGYTYSSEASKNSYPWNNQDLYIKQSPLFQADKCNTPLLLLHGDSDTNVPRGESIQFYTALKILGKEAELILIKDTDHWVQAYEQRIMWNNTILAWFDKHLKPQTAWWDNLYPENNLDK